MNNEKKKVRKLVVFLMSAVLCAVLVISSFGHKKSLRTEHECRFWGIVFAANNTDVKNLIRTHLDSLRSLGAQNHDGWGIAYFIDADSVKKLPVIARGGPSATADPRYYQVMQEMAQYIAGAGIAHVRHASTGPSGGIPDPHPFRRKCINRNFEFLLAHNGDIPITQLRNLIRAINPVYLDLNPPDYAPNYIDSDLYSIYIAEILDTYRDSTIESCLRTAVAKLDSSAGKAAREMNFVISDGTTLWVLNFTPDAGDFITAYYSPDTALSAVWTAASQPLDTLSGNWAQIPNKMLVTLRPNEQPVFTPIYGILGDTPSSMSSYRIFAWPVPFINITMISYHLPVDARVEVMIHDTAGRLVRSLYKGVKKAGNHTVFWNGCDDRGRQLASGPYFCRVKAGNAELSEKIIIAK